MSANIGIGKGGLVLSGAVALAMCLISYFFQSDIFSPPQYGICLTSPDSWELNGFISWIINTFLIGGIALLLYLINKSYNFIRTTEPALPAVFIVMAASNPWFASSLNTSVLLCLMNVVSLGIMFGAYGSGNATQQLFTVGLFIGIGSMFQYGFLPMTCVYILWALFLKVLRLKELLALIGGMVCPYWVGFGFGLLNREDLHLPSLTPFFMEGNNPYDYLFLLMGIGVAFFIGLLLTMSNGIKLYAGNSKVYNMNLCISILGLISLICILVDYENMPAYVVSLYMAVAVQIANLCALWNFRYPWLVTALPCAVYIGLFIGNIIL